MFLFRPVPVLAGSPRAWTRWTPAVCHDTKKGRENKKEKYRKPACRPTLGSQIGRDMSARAHQKAR